MKGWWLPGLLAALAWLAAPTERPVPFRAGETLDLRRLVVAVPDRRHGDHRRPREAALV